MEEWSFKEFLDRRDLWNNALRESVDNNVFLTWEWLSDWWRHFGDKRRFLVVTVIDGKKILAAAPLMISRSSLLGLLKVEFIGASTSDYHTFLLTEKSREPVKMILDYINQVEPSWGVLELNNVPEGSKTAGLLGAASIGSMRTFSSQR